ncbi:MAG: bactofilin family protein [Pseudomonadales bacterium]
MGFFKKSLPAQPKRNALTIIAQGNKISGDLAITGKLHIDGVVDGAITSIENISIGKSGIVKGIVKAKDVVVSGLLEGEVFCQHLHIEAGGRVVASVTSVDLTMDMKSQFIGERKESSLTQIEATTAQVQTDLDIVSDLPDKIVLPPVTKERRKSGTVNTITKSSLNLESANAALDAELAASSEARSANVEPQAKVQEVDGSEVEDAATPKAAKTKGSNTKPKVVDENTTVVELKV